MPSTKTTTALERLFFTDRSKISHGQRDKKLFSLHRTEPVFKRRLLSVASSNDKRETLGRLEMASAIHARVFMKQHAAREAMMQRAVNQRVYYVCHEH